MICFNSHTASLSSSVPYGRLEQFTELVVSPKIRAGIGNLSDSLERFGHDQQNPDLSSSEPSSDSTSHIPQSQQWGGIGDLKSLLRYLIKGTYDPVKGQPPVPNIPIVFSDSIYRVCGAPPDSLCSINHIAAGVVHVFPWNPHLNARGGQSAVTYGLLSKVLSPKEAKDKAKQAMEKKKGAGVGKDGAAVKGGEEVTAEEAEVVRVVCHVPEMLTGERRGHNKGEIHCGRVWVSVIW